MTTTTIAAAGLALAAAVGAVGAQPIADQVVTKLDAQGFQRIAVKKGPSQVKVAAIRTGRELGFVCNTRTCAILKQEVNRVYDEDRNARGVEISTEPWDFVVARNHDTDDPGPDGKRRWIDNDDGDEYGNWPGLPLQ